MSNNDKGIIELNKVIEKMANGDCEYIISVLDFFNRLSYQIRRDYMGKYKRILIPYTDRVRIKLAKKLVKIEDIVGENLDYTINRSLLADELLEEIAISGFHFDRRVFIEDIIEKFGRQER